MEEQEEKYKLPASFIMGTRRNTIDSMTRNPYAADERYVAYYETHCSDNIFRYYKVVDDKPVELARGLIGYVTAEQCQEWTLDAKLDDADKQFLRERFCDQVADGT